MANEGIHVPGEQDGSSLSPVEVKAREKGWRPQDEFRGNPDDWVDAKEFLGREKLFDKIRDLKGEVHRQQTKFDKDMEVISKHLSETEERAFEKAKKALQAQRRAALREGEPEQIEAIEADLEKLEEDKKKALAAIPKPSASSRPTPAFVEFQEANPWFKLSERGMPANEMTEDAIAIGTGYAAANPSFSQEKVLQYVAKKVKAMYREDEEDQNDVRPTKKEVQVESAGGGNRDQSVKASKKTKITRGDLSEDQRRIMDTLVKRGALKDKAAKNKVTQEAQYLMDLQEALGQ